MNLGRTQTALGAFYRRLAFRVGKAKAITATARKLAILVYRALEGDLLYTDPGADAYDAEPAPTSSAHFASAPLISDSSLSTARPARSSRGQFLGRKRLAMRARCPQRGRPSLAAALTAADAEPHRAPGAPPALRMTTFAYFLPNAEYESTDLRVLSVYVRRLSSLSNDWRLSGAAGVRCSRGLGGRSLLGLVITKDALDFLQRVCVQLHYLRLRAKCRRNNASGLILAIDIHHHPCLMHSVLASPICIAQEMGSAPQEDLDDPSTGQHRLFMRNLNEESFRHIRPPLRWSRAAYPSWCRRLTWATHPRPLTGSVGGRRLQRPVSGPPDAIVRHHIRN